MSEKLWGGRYQASTHPDVERYTASISFDQTMAFDDILGSLAHAALLQKIGLISAEEHEKLEKGLRAIRDQIEQGKIAFRVEDEDIHMNIERLLGEQVGSVAGKLHTARSRNDQVALDLHLYLRRHIVEIMDLLAQLQATLLQLSKIHKDTLMPGYTHWQRAQPIFLSQHFLAYVGMLDRDMARLKNSWSRVNQSPLGSAALTGTSFPVDRHIVADLLGFDGIYGSTLDAVSDRDFVIEFLSHASLIMMHLSRLSEELIVWSTEEFQFIEFDDAFCTGSSIMPQKKNPDVPELVRGKTGRVYGGLFSLLTVMKGLPLAYNKDLQEDKEPLFDGVKTLIQTLALMVPLLQTMTVRADRMQQATETGHLNATVLAEYLVKKGMPFREAHGVVGKMVAYCLDQSCALQNLSLEKMQSFSSRIESDVQTVLSLKEAAKACQLSAGVASAQAECSGAVQQHQAWVLQKRQSLQAVADRFFGEWNHVTDQRFNGTNT